MKKLTPSPLLAQVSAYSPPRSSAPIDLHLDGNEGAAPSGDLVRVLLEREVELLRRYPDASELEAEIAEFHDIDRSRVLVTAGADDALERALRALLAPGREMVLPVPTFGMIARFARLAGGAVVEVPWLEGPLPTDDIIGEINERTAVVTIVTPNSPTGLTACVEDIEKISQHAPQALLLVDLAYVEFADRDPTSLVLALPNAICTRTFSKAWGLAGLRVGYAMGSRHVIDWMRVTGHPYSVSAPSLLLARERFRRGRGEVRDFVERVKEQRAELARLLESLGARTLPSQGNFLLAKFDDGDALCLGLAERGIAVRPFPGKPHLESCVRITIPGNSEDFERLCRDLRIVMGREGAEEERL